MDKIYHYCSLDSFLAIIESKSLWLSNAKFSNDKMENQVVLSKENLLSEIINSDVLPKDEFIQSFKELNDFPYIICFSEKPDLLSQWRGYGDNGAGVCIGLSVPKIIELGIPMTTPVNYGDINRIGLKRIVYDSLVQDEAITRTIENINNTFSKEKNKDQYISLSMAALKMFSSFFKHNGFEEEEELRIIYTPTASYDTKSKREPKFVSSKKFRVSNGFIMPYYELLLDENLNSDMIPEIYLGPSCKAEVEDIDHFLMTHGLNTEIKVSKCTLRN